MTCKVRATISPSTAKIVTPLGKFLMTVPIEDLLLFLHKIGVQYTISGNIPTSSGKGYFRCKIFMQEGFKQIGSSVRTIEKYEGQSGRSVRAAVAGALARFLIEENHDYHDYKGLAADEEYEDAIV